MKRLLSLVAGCFPAACVLSGATGCAGWDAAVLVRRPQAALENKVLFVEPHQLHSSERYLDLEWGPSDHCIAIPIDLTTSVQTTSQRTRLVSIVTPMLGGSHAPASGLTVAYGFYDDDDDALPARCQRLENLAAPATGEARYVTSMRKRPGSSKRALLGGVSQEVASLVIASSEGDASVSVHKQLVIWFSQQFNYGDVIRLEIAQRTTDDREKERSGTIVGYSRFDFRMLRGPGILSGPVLGVGIIVLGTILLI